MSDHDIRREPITQARFCSVRQKVAELVEYMTTAGKKPETLAVYAGDYRALRSAINGRLRREAKSAERAANAGKPARDKVKIAADKVDELFFDGIPLRPMSYSRPRKVQP